MIVANGSTSVHIPQGPDDIHHCVNDISNMLVGNNNAYAHPKGLRQSCIINIALQERNETSHLEPSPGTPEPRLPPRKREDVVEFSHSGME